MKLFVGVTNDQWFRFLAERRPDEVNFWRPRSQMEFRALRPGDLFLFKLHSPLDFIAGGGVYGHDIPRESPKPAPNRSIGIPSFGLRGAQTAREFLEWHNSILRG